MNRFLFIIFFVSLSIRASSAEGFASEMMAATFKLYHPDSTATCFLVRPEMPDTALYLVTAAHTFERTKGETATVVLRDAKDDGSFVRHDHQITIRSDDAPLWVRHEKEDVAVLRLTESLPVAVAPLPISALADAARLKDADVHICSPLFVLTYPQRFEANGAAFPVARQGVFASPPMLPDQRHPTFLADFTTFSGDSGGPVFIAAADGHPLLVGIVLAQFHHDEKVKTEYEKRTIQHPLGLGKVLHASYVLETLEAASEKGEPSSE